MDKTLNLIYWQDPGHGWVQVPYSLLVTLGIESKITPYSYRNRHTAYLEEDCDASTFLDAAKARGYTVNLKSQHLDDFDNFIRRKKGIFRF